MKKLALIVLLVVGFSTYAQEVKQDRKGGEREKLSPEQRNQLQLKKMTLELNLNETQKKEMGKLIAEQSSKREAAMAERKASKEKGVKLTADERFKMQSQRLDEEVAMKEKIQKVLTADQFKKWEDMKKEKKEHMKDRMEKRVGKKADKKSE
jgi:hypothetical protein